MAEAGPTQSTHCVSAKHAGERVNQVATATKTGQPGTTPTSATALQLTSMLKAPCRSNSSSRENCTGAGTCCRAWLLQPATSSRPSRCRAVSGANDSIPTPGVFHCSSVRVPDRAATPAMTAPSSCASCCAAGTPACCCACWPKLSCRSFALSCRRPREPKRVRARASSCGRSAMCAPHSMLRCNDRSMHGAACSSGCIIPCATSLSTICSSCTRGPTRCRASGAQGLTLLCGSSGPAPRPAIYDAHAMHETVHALHAQLTCSSQSLPASHWDRSPAMRPYGAVRVSDSHRPGQLKHRARQRWHTRGSRLLHWWQPQGM